MKFKLPKYPVAFVALALLASLLISGEKTATDSTSKTSRPVITNASLDDSASTETTAPNNGPAPTTTFAPAAPQDPFKNPENAKSVPGEIIVSYKPDATESDKSQVRSQIAASGQSFTILADGTELVTLREGLSISDAKTEVAKSDVTEFSEPNYIMYESVLSNDPKTVDGTTWGMLGSTSSPVNTYGSNVQAAWTKGFTGSRDVYVVVIDGGVDYTHPDLAANIWTNTSEANGTPGVDDDGNGYIDDIHGYDFANNEGNVMPDATDFHGTHVAGTIGAVGGNNLGVSGVNWNVSIINSQFLQAGQGTAANAIQAIDYATTLRTKMGIDIIATNNSWGGPGSRALQAAIKRGGDAGILFVAAAGNSALNNDVNPIYPTNYDCSTSIRNWDCVISVAALNSNGELSYFSNFGKKSVDLAAPGENILSTTPGANYAALSGTSMAAPHVTGALALCAAANRGLSENDLKSMLLSSTQNTPSLVGRVATDGRLDVGLLLPKCAAAAQTFAGVPASVTATTKYTDLIYLAWNDNSRGEYEYEIQIAKGMAGCNGTFEHLAWIGPGLTSYPVRNLAESEFYCFRIAAFRLTSKTSYVKSNMEITYTSNLPFIFGQVLMADGTPVTNARVNWSVLAPTWSSTPTSSTYTDEYGAYAIQVVPGAGTLWIDTPRNTRFMGAREPMPSPLLPFGMRVGGTLTVAANGNDIFKNLTLPPIRTIQVTVKDGQTNAIAPNAKLRGSMAQQFCESGRYTTWANLRYKLFDGAGEPQISRGCQFWYASFSQSNYIVANDQGVASIAVIDNSLYNQAYSLVGESGTDAAVLGTSSVVASAGNELLDIMLPAKVTISGVVRLADGTPVSGLAVNWSAPYITSSFGISASTTTAADGSYSLAVTPGSSTLWVQTPDKPIYSTTPHLPFGFRASGGLDVGTTPVIKDLVMPPLRDITVHVSDIDTGQSISGALVRGEINPVRCEPTPRTGWTGKKYFLFAGATQGTSAYDGCVQQYITWNSAALATNSAGNAIVTVVDDSISAFDYTFTATHQGDASRVQSGSIHATATSNSVNLALPNKFTITGQVTLADGTPVKNATVNWSAADFVFARPVAVGYSDTNGNYSLSVSPGTGNLWISTPNHPQSYGDNGIYPTPSLPAGLRVGGQMVMEAGNVVKNLKLPAIRNITIDVQDMYTHAPVPEAMVRETSSVHYCESDTRRAATYKLFDGEIFSSDLYRGCQFFYASYGAGFDEAGANGRVSIPVIDDSLYGGTYTFTATHPLDNARTLATPAFRAISGSENQVVVLPGTPAKPTRPSATPTETSIELTWEEPWDGGAYIDYYNVAMSLESEGSFAPVQSGTCAGNIPPMDRRCTVTGLTPGTTYYFAIVAHNSVGYSQPSVYSVSTIVPPAALPIPSETPLPNPTPVPSISVTPTPTPTPTDSVAPTPTPTVSVAPTPTPTTTPSVSVAPTPTPTTTPSVSIAPTPTPTPTPTTTPTVSVTPTPTPSVETPTPVNPPWVNPATDPGLINIANPLDPASTPAQDQPAPVATPTPTPVVEPIVTTPPQGPSADERSPLRAPISYPAEPDTSSTNPVPVFTPIPVPEVPIVNPRIVTPPVVMPSEPVVLSPSSVIPATQVSNDAGIAVPAGAKVTTKVSKLSASVCKISSGKLKAKKAPGTCYVSVTVTTKKTKINPTSTSVTKSLIYLVK